MPEVHEHGDLWAPVNAHSRCIMNNNLIIFIGILEVFLEYSAMYEVSVIG